jgi:(+)-trans-carveol dehydrogenase
MRLEGKVMVVTGAAGGIGRAACARLAQDGAKVVALDLWPNGVDQAVPAALAVAADVSRREAMEDAARQVMQAFGRIDGLFVNAGILRAGGVFEATEAEWTDTLSVNVDGAFNTIRALARPMVQAGQGGSIVLTSSISGLKSVGKFIAYTTSKHAVVGLMRGCAQELGPAGIRVNSIHPTSVRTDMVESVDHARRMLKRQDATIAELQAVYRERHALPVAWLDPEDVANAVAWLMSDEARYVTGNTLTVDAGFGVR